MQEESNINEDAEQEHSDGGQNMHGSERRQQRMIQSNKEIMSAMREFAPTLKKIVDSNTDYSLEVKTLKQLRKKLKKPSQQRQQKAETNEVDGLMSSTARAFDSDDEERERELWEGVKRKSITRLLLTAYAHTLLFLVLYIQILILGRLQLDEEKEEKAHDADFPVKRNESSKVVLTKTYEFFFARGLPALSSAIEAAVDKRLCCWTVMNIDQMSEREFEAGIDAVRWNFDSENAITSFVVQGNEVLDQVKDLINRVVLEETWDIMESPLFANAWKESIGQTLIELKGIWMHVFKDRRNELSDPSKLKFPLATIVTRLRNCSNLFYCEDKGEKTNNDRMNAQLSRLFSLQSVGALGNACINF